MNDAFDGGAIVAALAISLFFLRFAKSTGDRFHLLFAWSFGLLAANRALLLVIDDSDEAAPVVFLVRAAAFALIIFAVLDKNLQRDRRPR